MKISIIAVIAISAVVFSIPALACGQNDGDDDSLQNNAALGLCDGQKKDGDDGDSVTLNFNTAHRFCDGQKKDGDDGDSVTLNAVHKFCDGQKKDGDDGE
jgi:hypothetical protein